MFNLTEKDIFTTLLERASDEMSNNGCNDYPVPVTEENTKELETFIRGFANGRNQRDELLEQLDCGKEVVFSDWMLLRYLKGRIGNC